MLHGLYIILIMPACNPFVEVFWRSWLLRVALVELLKPLWATYEVPSRVPGRIRVVALPIHTISKGSTYNLAGQDFFDFPFIPAVNLNWQRSLIRLAGQRI